MFQSLQNKINSLLLNAVKHNKTYKMQCKNKNVM